jgi:hypothetical protein
VKPFAKPTDGGPSRVVILVTHLDGCLAATTQDQALCTCDGGWPIIEIVPEAEAQLRLAKPFGGTH